MKIHCIIGTITPESARNCSHQPGVYEFGFRDSVDAAYTIMERLNIRGYHCATYHVEQFDELDPKRFTRHHPQV